MEKSLRLCGREIHYELLRKKVKNINLRIKPDGSLHISAPSGLPTELIESFLRSKEQRICGILDKYRRQALEHPMPERAENGAEITVLGKPRRIVILKGGRGAAELEEDRLLLRLREPDNPEAVQRLLDKYLRQLSREVVEYYCRLHFPEFQRQGVSWPEIKYRRMRSRWGSCCPQTKVLTFNTALAYVPPECSEYVVVHEFCHFFHADHSAAFYRKVEEVLPGWREKEKVLSNYAGISG